MTKTIIIWVAGLVALCLAGFAGWIASLPPAPTAAEGPVIPAAETTAMLASLRPDREGRPLIAIVGINDATETTDYLMTAGILRRADVADVVILATEAGPVQLYPALRVEPDSTIAAFDAEYPEGADYVIVPAMSRDDDPAVLAWLKAQSLKGATIVGVCAGAKVVGAAGLLDGRRATTHWYYRADMLRRTPTITYVADRRMVADGKVVTTTGISASMPMMLTLIEAIAGRPKAEAVARDLGAATWDARHASAAFRLTRPFATTVLVNRMAFWNRETFVIGLEQGMDEVSLALVADAWSRTYRSGVTTYSPSGSAVISANGMRILPDETTADWPGEHRLELPTGMPTTTILDRTLQDIARRYGGATADVVAMQLEYPWHATPR